jgi:hypothetical protein
MSKPHEQKRIDKARFEPVIERCREMALSFLDKKMAHLFEHAGPVMLDFAERAENNALQGRFFEAMSLLKSRQADIEYTFRVEINEGFDRFSRMGRLSDSELLPTEGIELSLVEQEDMEESVACENLTLRANASFFPELFALAQRLSVVNGGIKLKDSEVPASPHHLVRSFNHALHSLDVEIKIKVLLYALFDRFVVRDLGEVYDQFNEHLKEAGVLPNLKPVPVRKPDGKAPPSRKSKPKEDDKTKQPGKAGGEKSPGKSGDGGLANELFDSILDLMSKRRPGDVGTDSNSYGMNTPASPELLNAISKIQAQSQPALGVAGAGGGLIPNIEIDAAFLDRVKDTLTQERQHIRDQVKDDEILPVDNDLIDLIGMLFEYMLNDPVLPNSAKALLSHLHTPYLKVAMLDRRMLVDNRHPARRLLDQMIEGGSLWVEEGNPNRGIFPAMRKAVDRVLLEFTDNVTLFEDLLSDFEEAMREQRRRIETMEQRSQESARGKERLQLARQQAIRQIQDITSSRLLPRAVTLFLNKVWIDHLVFTLLRDSQRSEAWEKAVETAETLVALFDPESAAIPASKLAAQATSLRAKIIEQTQTVDDSHRNALDALLAVLDQPPSTWLQTAEPVEAIAESNAAEGIAPEDTVTGEDDEQGLSSEEKELIERLRKLRFGTWIELATGPGNKPRRVKLSWMSPLTSTCMFVDRSGMQAEVKTLRELAQQILAEEARIIPAPKHAFIDRALMSIRKILQGDEKGRDAETAAAE